MKKARLNSLMCNPPQDNSLTLKVGVRSSFVAESEDSDSSDFEIPNLVKQMSRGGSKTTEPAISCSNHAQLSSAPKAAQNGSQNGEYLEEMLIPMFRNAKIQQSAPQPRESLNMRPSQHDTHQPQSYQTQNYQTPSNQEQHPQLHHQQQHDKFSPVEQHLKVYTPQHQQPGLGYGQQTFQFPVSLDPRYLSVYPQQVQASPSPQPPVYQLTPQTHGPSLLIQPSPPVAPHEYGRPTSISTTSSMDQQQYPYQEVSCSDTQSVSSVGSSYPSLVSTPVYHGSYYDHNLGNQLMISPLSTQCYPPSQVITQNVVPSHDVPPFYLTNGQGCAITSDMKCDINQMTDMSVSSSNQSQRPLKLEKVSANTHINIAPPQQMNTKNQSSLTTRGRESSIYLKNFSYTEEQHERYSNLYVNWTETAEELRFELEQRNLEVHNIQTTSIKDLWNVVFDSHSSARKAFTTQRDIQIRMVPPQRSKKNWFRNPSPKFLVQYETKCRLDVREGKAVVHDLVGVLLMSRSTSQESKGCRIWADQLKGHRIRIVGCVGRFMFPTKRVIDMKEIPPKPVGNDPIGWVSYRNRHTRDEYVTRISGNLLQEYIYNG